MRGQRGLSIALLSILLFQFGCSHKTRQTQPIPATGTLSVRLTDAPLDLANVQSLNVTLTGLIVYPRERGTFGLPDPGRDFEDGQRPVALLAHPTTIDLLTLTHGASILLASGDVPAGSYDRIRLEIAGANIVYKDQTSATLQLESNKVDIPSEFSLTANGDASITLDFDGASSVHVDETSSGSLNLRPVVTPVHST